MEPYILDLHTFKGLKNKPKEKTEVPSKVRNERNKIKVEVYESKPFSVRSLLDPLPKT